MAKKYGDLFYNDIPSGMRMASVEGNSLPRVQTTDGRTLDLALFPDDVLTDEYLLTVVEYLPDGRATTRLYDKKESDRVSNLIVGDPALLSSGIGIEELSGFASSARNVRATESEPDADDNSIQTKTEVDFAKDETIKAAIENVLKNELGECQPLEKRENISSIIRFPLTDGREVPLMIITVICVAGNDVQSWLEFPVAEAGQIRRVCSTTWKVAKAKEFMLKQVQKSTKISLSMGLGFGPSIGSPTPTNGEKKPDGDKTPKQKDVTPKEGEPVFENGQPKTKSDGSRGLINVNFDFGFIREYAKLTVKANNNLAGSVEEIKCTPAV